MPTLTAGPVPVQQSARSSGVKANCFGVTCVTTLTGAPPAAGTTHSDEPSLLATYLPARGLERITITYDPLSDVDSDGDGDPHTSHTAELVARGDAVLPELEDLVRAMPHCTGTICVSEDHEFRFVLKSIGVSAPAVRYGMSVWFGL